MGSNESKSTEPRIYFNKKIEIRNLTAYTGNNSFIVLVSNELIYIYHIDAPNNKEKIILKEMASIPKMHPFYKTIF